MAPIFTVNSFCGCCDLKTSCVVIAAITIAANIIYLLICFFVFFLFGYILVESSKESVNENKNKNFEIESNYIVILLSVLFFVTIIVCIATIVCSYWFIKGVTSKNPVKMKYYLIIIAINVILQVLQFNIISWIIAVFECYIFICSYTVYEQLLNPLPEDGVNTTENTVIRNALDPPPPPYNVAYNAIEKDDRSAGYYLKQIP